MEYADYHIIYVDNRMSRELDGKLIQRTSSDLRQESLSTNEQSSGDESNECLKSILGEIEEVRSNLRSIFSVFNGGKSYLSSDYFN